METSTLSLTHPTQVANHVRIPLPSSKSESNRALIIQALSPTEVRLENLASARDTQTMIRLLNTGNAESLDVLDAGTTMRFLTAYCTVKKPGVILTGTPRMKERPIKLLVDALRTLGGEIEYLENEGYPPIKIQGFSQKSKQVSIRGDVSSQYISALLMAAPTLPEGLELTLEGAVGSRPYIEMTLRLMGHFGVVANWEGNVITVAPQAYQTGVYRIESDWSGASYWYSVAALSKEANMTVLGLRRRSWQGDRAIVEIMAQLGVNTQFY